MKRLPISSIVIALAVSASAQTLPHKVERIPVTVRGGSSAKQANTTLVLAVFWIFSGGFGGSFQPDATQTVIVEKSGLTSSASGPVAVALSAPYKKAEYPSRLYFKVEGEMQLWWSGDTPPAKTNLVQLSPAWLAASTELAADLDHPAGGLSFSSSAAKGGPLAFYIEFAGQKIASLGTE